MNGFLVNRKRKPINSSTRSRSRSELTKAASECDDAPLISVKIEVEDEWTPEVQLMNSEDAARAFSAASLAEEKLLDTSNIVPIKIEPNIDQLDVYDDCRSPTHPANQCESESIDNTAAVKHEPPSVLHPDQSAMSDDDDVIFVGCDKPVDTSSNGSTSSRSASSRKSESRNLFEDFRI